MSTYNAQDIIDKSLTAQTPVQLKRLPSDSAPVVYTVAAGAPVGTVFSYLMPSNDRRRLYWMFKDEKGKPYYAENSEGRYKISALKAQGVITTEDKTKAEQLANEPIKDTITRTATRLVLIAAAAYVAAKVLPNMFKK